MNFTIQTPPILMAQNPSGVLLWVILFGALFLGIFLGKKYLHQNKALSEVLDASTRQDQGHYDLAARDIIKARQDASARLKQIDQANQPQPPTD